MSNGIRQTHNFWTLLAISLSAAAVSAAVFRYSQDFLAWWVGFGPWGHPGTLTEQFELGEPHLFRIVRAAGSGGCFLVAFFLLAVRNQLRWAATGIRYFVWLTTMFCLCAAFVHPVVSIASGRGDWAWFLIDFEPALIWRASVTLLAGILAAVGLAYAARGAEVALDRTKAREALRRSVLAAPVAGTALLTVTAWLLGFAGPHDPLLHPSWTLVAAATMGVTATRTQIAIAQTPHEARLMGLSAGWATAAAASAAVVFFSV